MFDPDLIVWLVFGLIYLVGAVASQIKKLNKNRPGQQPGPQTRQPPPPRPGVQQPQPTPSRGRDDVVRELMRQMGLELEPAVAEEHRPTASEHRPTASEQVATASETRWTEDEHRQDAASASATASEHRWTEAEHVGTASEHRAGDVRVGALPPITPIGLIPTAQRRTRVDHGIRSQLRNRVSLARAIMLRDILGPPVALRKEPPGTGRGPA